MNRRTQKLILVVVTLALVFSPVQGAFALAPVSVAEVPDHCANMQDSGHAMDHMAGMQDTTAVDSDRGCDRGCDGSCCDGACNTCAHGSIALPGAVAAASAMHANQLQTKFLCNITGRTVHPPFRPPIALHS